MNFPSNSSFEGFDTLVTAKRPIKRSKPAENVPPGRRESRFLSLVRSIRSSLKRNRRFRPRRLEAYLRGQKSRAKSSKSCVDERGVKDIVHKVNSSIKIVEIEGGVTGKKRLKRDHCEQLEPFKLLIEPPASFRNDESRENLENKLNTLDLRRMNTVAIPVVDPFDPGSIIYSWSNQRIKNRETTSESQKRRSSFERFYVDTNDIQRTMIDLLVRPSILKKKKVEAVRSILFEAKTVRFEEDRPDVSSRKSSSIKLEDWRAMGKKNAVMLEEIVNGSSVLLDDGGVCLERSLDLQSDVAESNGKGLKRSFSEFECSLKFECYI